jgi:hypothetical protein
MVKPLTPRQEKSAAYLLQLKKVRQFLSAHPGSTCSQVTEVVGHGLMDLQLKGLACWKREEGEVRWYAKDAVARPWTERYQEEQYAETNETKWVSYKP